MARFLLTMLGFAGCGLLLLYVAGTLGAGGLVIVGLVEVAVIATIYRASARA